jgi:pimeloyl-ACP methyl ester carboxylesterase
MSTMLGSPRQIDVGVLSVGYVEVGPADGRVVLLLHGWPYDIHSYDDVAPSRVASARHGSCRATRCGTANQRPSRPTWST